MEAVICHVRFGTEIEAGLQLVLGFSSTRFLWPSQLPGRFLAGAPFQKAFLLGLGEDSGAPGA